MLGRIRHLIPATYGFIGVAGVVWAGSAYLPAVGPVPLRFSPLSAPATNWGCLPPPSANVAPSSSLPGDQDGTASAIEALTPVFPLTTNSAEPYTAEAQSPEPPSPPAETVTPAMLLKYLLPTANAAASAATNAPIPGPALPVGFSLPSGLPQPAPPTAPPKAAK